MSVQKIARLAGVSVATVSRVLNNIESVKPKNREKVLSVINELNYKPNLLARQLRTAKSKMLLVLVSNIANPFCADVVKGIELEAEKNGYHILLCNACSDVSRSQSSLSLLSGKMVDGVITMDALSHLPELTKLIGDSPWVQCAEFADAANVSCVGIDDKDASRFAIQKFIEQGRNKIAMINHDLNYKYAQLREDGYREEIDTNHCDYKKIQYADELSYEAGKEAMSALLLNAEKPDAVFAVSDTLAVGALKAIEDAGLKVPDDIAVIGFDGTELGTMINPKLSTIQQPSENIGREAVRLLLNHIDNPGFTPEKIILEWQFISRDSL
ncbi:LacI family DNA-binding transcriptional regulator [Aeromonas caviae]|uniref:LacI family DNA-binding transcriptional regulator n=1 Tax=Aeromonas caviae TaxID=648 RepID=UPI003F74956A